MLTYAGVLQHCRALLNEIWKHVTQMTDALEYVCIAKVYVEFVTKCFGDAETTVMLERARARARE